MARRNSSKGPRQTDTESYQQHSYANINRWALVVGISDYEYGGKGINPLRYAHLDAEQFAVKLKSPACGSFPEHNVKLLTNEGATLIQVQKALRSFLSEPKEEDLVIIYFSGHGAPDPKRPEQRYFFTFDTHPEDISGTALPMREIRTCVAETLRAKWVVVIADACHSGALTATKSGGSDAKALNQFMSSLKNSKKSLAWLTSSQANQLSYEPPHDSELENGVFTHFLLRGMDGEADGFPNRDKDGVVTIEELFEYVREKVKEYTGGTQLPTPGPGDFDPKLPLAYSGEAQAKDYFEAGKLAMHLGEILSDPDRFQAAEYYFKSSQNVSKYRQNYAAELLRARSLAARGRIAEAILLLEGFTRHLENQLGKGALAPHGLHVLGEALYLLGVFYLLEGRELDQIESCLKQMEKYCPDHPRVLTIRELLKMHSSQRSRLFAILVGINEYDSTSKLSGALNDVAAIEQALVKRWGDAVGEVKVILNQEATKTSVEAAFKEVSNQAQPLDSFFFHFSGMGGDKNPKGTDWVLMLADAKIEEREVSAGRIHAKAFHQLIKSVPCINKHVSIDCNASRDLANLLKEEPIYNLMYGVRPGQMSIEVEIEGKSHGAFSRAIADALDIEVSSKSSFWQNVVNKVRNYTRERGFTSSPFLIGEVGIGSDTSYSFTALLQKVFFLSRRIDIPDYTLIERYFQNVTFFPELHLRLIFYVVKSQKADDSNYQDSYAEQIQEAYEYALPEAISINYRKRSHVRAIQSMMAYQEQPIDLRMEHVFDLHKRESNSAAHVLLIGVDHFAPRGSSQVSSCLEDLRQMRSTLLALGLKEENIETLVGETAAYVDILSAFQKLTEKTAENPCLFYFSGPGAIQQSNVNSRFTIKGISEFEGTSSKEKGEASIMSADAQLIPLSLFEKLAHRGYTQNLCAIFDAGLRRGSDRFNDDSATDADRGIEYEISFEQAIPIIGACTLLPGYITQEGEQDKWEHVCKTDEHGGIFTQQLTRALEAIPFDELNIKNIQEWVKSQKTSYCSGQLHPRIYGDQEKLLLKPDAYLLDDKTLLRQAKEKLSAFAKNEHRAMIELAYVQHLLGDSLGAVRNLDLLRGKDIPMQLPLGRILVESDEFGKEKWNKAIAMLREASPSPAVSYYLGKAILGSIRMEKETEVEALFQQYAEARFPLGGREEVEGFLYSRNPSQQITRLLENARNLEWEGKATEALVELKKAAALGDAKAIEEQVRIYAARQEWEKVISVGLDAIGQEGTSDASRQQIARIVFYALAQPSNLRFAREALKDHGNETDSRLLGWLDKYQRFIEENPA
jgi:uncharacterized caspase-like protein